LSDQKESASFLCPRDNFPYLITNHVAQCSLSLAIELKSSSSVLIISIIAREKPTCVNHHSDDHRDRVQLYKPAPVVAYFSSRAVGADMEPPQGMKNSLLLTTVVLLCLTLLFPSSRAGNQNVYRINNWPFLLTALHSPTS
jgi:hypothetical protein